MTKKRVLFWLFGILFMAVSVSMMVIVTTCEVKSVEIRGNTRYSDEQVKEMVLTGPFSQNSVLAPLLCSKENVSDIYFVDGWTVTRTGKDSLMVTLNEKKPVGCISYLDNYIYFDKNGCFVDASVVRDEQVPYFSGIKVDQVVENEKIPIRGTTVLDTAVTLTTVFQKEENLPDRAEFDSRGEVSLSYDDVVVSLGKNEYMEDKMSRAAAILPQLEGKKGTLHLESVSEKSKIVTFEPSADYVDAQDALGNYFKDEAESGPEDETSDEEEDLDADEEDPEEVPDEEDAEDAESYGSSGEYTDDQTYDDYDYDDQSYDDYDDYDDSYDEYDDYDGGADEEAYYDQLYEGIYW